MESASIVAVEMGRVRYRFDTSEWIEPSKSTFELTDVLVGMIIVDEWDFADGRLIQSIKMPANSGPVSFVKSLPNNKHIIW